MRSLILSTYYGNFINVRWFLIVQLVENSVFSSPKIFKTELVLRFLQITEKPIQKMIQERVQSSASWMFVTDQGFLVHFVASRAAFFVHGPVHDYLLTLKKPIKSKLIECYYQCDNIQCSIREPFIGQIQGSTELYRTVWEIDLGTVPRSLVR